MTFSIATRESATANALSIDAQRNFSGDSQLAIQQTVTAGTTDQEILAAIDISLAKLVMIKATVDMTLKTNSTGAPDDTLSLKAGIPMVWRENDYNALFLSADVTKFYATNGGAADGTLQILALIDLP